MTTDPLYETRPARFISWYLENVHDMELVIDDHLRTRSAVNPNERVIWVRPGLSLADYQWAVCRGLLFAEYPEAVPEFGFAPVNGSGGIVVPFPRLHASGT